MIERSVRGGESSLCREAIPARSYMNGLISFARTKEETTETMPQTSK